MRNSMMSFVCGVLVLIGAARADDATQPVKNFGKGTFSEQTGKAIIPQLLTHAVFAVRHAHFPMLSDNVIDRKRENMRISG